MIDIILAASMGALGATTVFSIYHNKKIDELTKELRDTNSIVEFNEAMKEYWYEVAIELERSRNRYKQRCIELQKQTTPVSEDIEEAIYFAMKNSHPDKPCGDAEKFRKFFALYKKYCK